MTDTSRNRKRVAVLISGRGSNMQAIVEAAKRPDYPAEVVSVISNCPNAPGLNWAKENGIAAKAVDHTAFNSRDAFEAELHAALTDCDADLVACAGFLRILTENFVASWEQRMLNIHPSLLPAFKGLDTHRRAIGAGVKLTGCTVHYVTAALDSGPIIAQAAVPVLSSDTADTLARRVLAAEHRLYPEALRLVASGQAKLESGRVRLCDNGNGQDAFFAPAINNAA